MHTKLLGLTGKEWVAEILGDKHPLSLEYKNISPKVRGYFFYKGQDSKSIILKHVASGKKFRLAKKSVNFSDDLTEIDTVVLIGIVRWKNEWVFSGIFAKPTFDPDLIQKEKKSTESRNQVAFLDYDHESLQEVLNSQYKSFMEFNQHKQLAFMETKNVHTFMNEFISYFNKSLKVSTHESAEAEQKTRNEGYLGENELQTDLSEYADNGLVFFNPKSGIEIAIGLNSAFPTANNPYYHAEESEDHLLGLFFDDSISKELVEYCIENYKDEIPYWKTHAGKIILDNADFLLRFFKKGNYFSKPSITLTGLDNKDVL